MMYNARTRLGSTAIAAVLALSATTAAAQDAAPPAEETVTTTSTTTSELANDPLAPTAEATTTTGTKTAVAPAAKATAKPSKKIAARLSAPAKPLARASAVAAAPAETASAAPLPPAVPVPDSAAMTETVAPASVVEPAPKTEASMPKQVLPIAGAGLGALALAGIGLAIRRRRREEEEEDAYVLDEQPTDEPFREPAAPARATPTPYVEPIASAPLLAAAPSSPSQETDYDLPEGFDLSRFGPHVQAAYKGPSADNPSVSLKKRLKVARAMDQRDRLEGVATPPQSTAPSLAKRTETPSAIGRPVMSQFKPNKVAFGQPKDKPAFQY